MKLIINGASVSFGVNEILKDVNFEINEQEKIAIVGRNGSGKTTLLKLITGELDPDVIVGGKMPIEKIGKIDIGYLEQITFNDENITLEEEILKIFEPVIKLKDKLKDLETKLANNPTEKLMNTYIATEHNFELLGGYTFQKSYNMAFKKFGFLEEDKKRKLCEFSGGQKTKIALVKLLFSNPDILVLDEPTNHLDIEAIEWLEEFLAGYKKSVILVSHDREFLDRVATIVCEIENKKITRYVGNYSQFVLLKKEEREKQQKAHQKYVQEVERISKVVDRFRYKATKASMAQSKLKQIERMEEVKAPEKENNLTFHFKLDVKDESATEVLKLDKLVYGYNSPLGEVSAKIYKGNKIAIVGANGTGKSTLLKTIMGIVPLLGGKIKIGQNVKIGYFDQQAISLFETNETVLENFTSSFPTFSVEEARNLLGAFMFSKEDVFKPLSSLSGGERVRLELAKIFNTHPNFLILDEPTNHLDILSKITLEEMLKNFEGTILFVSHDRYFVKTIANGIISLENGGCEFYKNTTYNEFLTKFKTGVKKPLLPETVQDVVQKNKEKSDYLKNKEKQKKLNILEGKIKKAEQQIKELKEAYNAPENCSNIEVLIKLQSEIDVVQVALDELLEEWINLN